jgi:hypothetical protein
MFGQGIFAIDNVRIENGKLMLDCVDRDKIEGTRTISMTATEAQALVDEIWHTATDYQNKLRRELQSV